MAHCPPLPDSSSSSVVLHDRGLSGVVALGLFAVESELAHHGVKVLHYLLQLLESLPRASWVQNTLASAKRGGRRELVQWNLSIIDTKLLAPFYKGHLL